MNIEDIQISTYKYKVSKFNILIPGQDEPYTVDDAHIGNFTIEKDFDNYVFPYIEFRIIVTDAVHRSIMKESENVYVDVKVEYCHFDEFYEDDPAQASDMDGTLFDTRFYAFINDNSPKLTDETLAEQNKEKEADGDITQYQYDDSKEIVMMLYRADHIFNTKKIVNIPLSKVTVTDIFAYYFKQIGLSGVLMSPAENTKIYDQMVLIPIPSIGGMRKIIMTYGVHNAGTRLFFDSDIIYVLNKKLGCTAWRDNEHKTVYLISFPNTAGDSGIMRSGFYSNDQEKYDAISIVGNQISITNEAMFDDQLTGGNIVMVDSSTGKISQVSSQLKVSDMSLSKTGAVNQVLVMDSGSDQSNVIKQNIEYNQKTLTIYTQDINIAALVPNRDFVFTTDNEKYNQYCGHYQLKTFGATFTRESSLFTVQVSASFVGGAQSV